jgi:ribosomal protein L24E
MRQTRLNGPVLGSVASPTGKGYYMVASDGGIFAFGDAAFAGSMGGTKLNAAVQSLVPDADGKGYWLVASDGGIFAFDAPFRGSMGATRLNKPVVGMVRFGDGYLMVGADGGIFNFSSAPLRVTDLLRVRWIARGTFTGPSVRLRGTPTREDACFPVPPADRRRGGGRPLGRVRL